jgi:hypothetical protein
MFAEGGLIFGAACVGAVWATYQRSTTAPPYGEAQIPALIWTVFATPFAMFWGMVRGAACGTLVGSVRLLLHLLPFRLRSGAL